MNDLAPDPKDDSRTLMQLQVKQLQAIQDALTRLRSDALGAAAFADLAQAQHDLLAALPPRFPDVLMQLLSRLESSALFTEESCSFSRHDLLDSLQLWLDKAAQALGRAGPG